jgi:hypothetical protein
MRKNIFEGVFYEADFEKLDEEINRCFISRFGPGDLPIKRYKKIKGIRSPCDKYKLSGGGMAWSYKEIAEAEFAKTYVILGMNSKKLGRKFACSLENWESVFGDVKVDVELANKLMEKTELKVDEELHIRESSIEVQLPFLQFVNKDRLKEIKILPILINCEDYEELKKFGEVLGSFKDIIIIMSSDFSEVNENYKPFEHNLKESVYDMDKKGMKLICELKSKEFFDFKKEKNIKGGDTIIVGMEAVKTKGRLLHYYSSGDVNEDYENFVGYGSLVFE